MKTLAILLMLLTVLMMAGFGMFYLLGFAMSFDAPGSTIDPKAWLMRVLMFAPFFILLAVLILSWKAYAAGNYQKSVILGVISPAICVALYIWMMASSIGSMKKYNDQVAAEKEMEAKYPKEQYVRQTSLGTDSIIVWPSGIVAYRLHIPEMENTWDGPLGDLNKSRDSIVFDRTPDTRIKFEELNQFMDEKGRIFTNVYVVK